MTHSPTYHIESKQVTQWYCDLWVSFRVICVMLAFGVGVWLAEYSPAKGA